MSILSTEAASVYPQTGSVRSSGPSWGFFQIDNEVIMRYGRQLGPVPIAVYSALAMHAGNTSSSCFPAQETLADELGIGSRNTLSKALQRLKDVGLIDFETTRGSKGRYVVTSYTLLPLSKETPRAEFEHGPRAEFEHGPRAEFEQEQYPIFNNTQREQETNNQPSEPTIREIAPEDVSSVGSSLTGGGAEQDVAIEPTGGAIIESLRQIATQKGIEPKQPTKDLVDKLSSAAMTTQGEVIGYVMNYHKPIKSFWGLVNWCLNNPKAIKGCALPISPVSGQQDASGNPYRTEDQWTEEETAPVAQIHTGHDDDGFDLLRTLLLQQIDLGLGTLKHQDVRLISRETDHYVVGVMAYAGTVEQLNVREDYQKRLYKILENVGVNYHNGRIPSVHFECALSRSNFISAHPITQARAHAMVGDD